MEIDRLHLTDEYNPRTMAKTLGFILIEMVELRDRYQITKHLLIEYGHTQELVQRQLRYGQDTASVPMTIKGHIGCSPAPPVV
jgi:hypothetical protein